jgi:hypothetical protein
MAEREKETDFGSGFTLLAMSACAFLYLKEVPQKFVSGLNSVINGTSASSNGKDPVAPAPASRVKHVGPPARAKNQPLKEKRGVAESRTTIEYKSAKAEVERLGGYVGVDWALGEVKSQKSEGACTAFAVDEHQHHLSGNALASIPQFVGCGVGRQRQCFSRCEALSHERM